MKSKVFNTYKEVDEWLSEYCFFEDGCILSVGEKPIEIIIGYDIRGNYKANTERHIAAFKLVPNKIYNWSFDESRICIGENNYIENIDVTETQNGMKLKFYTPTLFTLETNTLYIEKLETIKTVFHPWTSDTEIFASANIDSIPTPSFWIGKLKESGHDVAFRYYCGEAKEINKIPYPDYQGYYIQTVKNIQTSKEGIFIKHMQLSYGKLNLSLENKDNELVGIWADFTKIISDFPEVKIHCGNCEFTGEEWKAYLRKI